MTLADSFSLLPQPLHMIGKALGIFKTPLPDFGGTEAEWLGRCRSDVDITSTALLQLLDWWDSGHLGNWSITGPSCGWSTLRHRPARQKVVVQPDQPARTFERQAVAGGRREVWQVGRLRPGLYADLDFTRAHLTAATAIPLPIARGKPFDSLPLTSAYLTGRVVDVMARCRVRTETPRYPLRLPDGIWHPVGDFWTTLCGPELREALQRGELVEVGAGYPYRMGFYMRDWARWVDGLLENAAGDVPPMAQIAAKGWSRSVPGRWAAHTSDRMLTRRDVRPGWHLEDGMVMPGRHPATFLTVGGRQEVWLRDLDADDSFPAVLAWIQSWTRVQLGRLIDHFHGCVVQCNTDGALIDLDRLAFMHWIDTDERLHGQSALLQLLDTELDRVRAEIAPMRIRAKAIAHTGEVLSPQHVILEDAVKLSGVPASAERKGRYRWHFTTWPGMRSQIAQGNSRGYVQGDRTVDLSQVPVYRWRLSDGGCEAPRAIVNAAGESELKPWDPQLFVDAQLDRSRPQQPRLEKMLRAQEEAERAWRETTGRRQVRRSTGSRALASGRCG